MTKPTTLVLDDDRYQHNSSVEVLEEPSGITLLVLPSYSPKLNLIGRLWDLAKSR